MGFSDCFSCIYEDMKGLHWLFSADSFHAEDQPQFLEYKNWRASFEDLFPKFENDIDEDWNGLYAFKPSSIDLVDFAKLRERSKDRTSLINEHCYLMLCSVDYAYWILFSNDDSLLDKLKSNHSEYEEYELENDGPWG